MTTEDAGLEYFREHSGSQPLRPSFSGGFWVYRTFAKARFAHLEARLATARALWKEASKENDELKVVCRDLKGENRRLRTALETQFTREERR